MDLIDRQAVLSIIRRGMPEETSGSLLYQSVKQLPTVDAVEVVRCKDCKYWTRSAGDDQWSIGDCNLFDKRLVMCNGFCAWAERRTDELGITN